MVNTLANGSSTTSVVLAAIVSILGVCFCAGLLLVIFSGYAIYSLQELNIAIQSPPVENRSVILEPSLYPTYTILPTYTQLPTFTPTVSIETVTPTIEINKRPTEPELPTATLFMPSPTEDISAKMIAIGCICSPLDENDPNEKDCSQDSFVSTQEAQECFNYCMEKTNKDIYNLDGDTGNGLVCEGGLN